MKVQILKNTRTDKGFVEASKEPVEVPDKVGRQLIASQKAVEVVEEASAKEPTLNTAGDPTTGNAKAKVPNKKDGAKS